MRESAVLYESPEGYWLRAHGADSYFPSLTVPRGESPPHKAAGSVVSHRRSSTVSTMSDVTSTEQPFKLAVPDESIQLLKKKLELARFPDELEGAGREYGAPLADVTRLTTHWKTTFDWRKAEAEINKLPMFTRDIEVEGFGTLNIHYIHQKSDVKDAIPLLFVHGCKYRSVCFGWR